MLRRVNEAVTAFGLGDGILYLFHQVLRRASSGCGLHVYELMAQPITSAPLLPDNLAKQLTFTEIPAGHSDIANMPAREEIKTRRFEQGARCLGVYLKGQLTGYIWYCFGSYEEDEVRYTYQMAEPEHTVFDFDLHVLPKYRMGIGFLAVMHAFNQHLASKGVDYSFSRLTRFNLASRKSHSHLGLVPIARTYCLQIGKLEIMFAGISPFIAVTWSPRQRVRLKLGPRMLKPRQVPH